jgi:CHAT domain-containing protein
MLSKMSVKVILAVIFTVGVLVSLAFNFSSDNPLPSDSAQKAPYRYTHPNIKIADSLFTLRLYDEALVLLSITIEDLESASDFEGAVNVLNHLGFTYRRIRRWAEAQETLNRAIALGEQHFGSSHIVLSNSYFYLGGVFDRMGMPERAIENFDKALTIRISEYGENNSEVANVLLGIGDVYRFNYADYDNSFKFYERALKIQETTLDSNDLQLANNYYNIASIQRLKGEYESALIYAQQAIGIYNDIPNLNPNILANSYLLLGNIFFGQANYNQAIVQYQRAVDITIENKAPTNNLGDFYNALGASYMLLENRIPAKNYYFKAEYELKNSPLGNSQKFSSIYDNLGLIYKDLNMPDSALFYHQKALDTRLNSPTSLRSEIAQSYRFLGDYYRWKENLEKALDYYQQSITTITGFEASNRFELLPEDLLIEDQDLLKAIAAFSTTLKRYSLTQDDPRSHLITALNGLKQADFLLSKNRQSSDRDGTKLFLSEYYRQIYEEALDCVWRLNKFNGNGTFIEDGLAFMNKSKGLTLLENLSGAEAQNSIGIPDSLKNKENKLKTDIAALNNQIQKLKVNEVENEVKLAQLNQDLLVKIREQELFKERLSVEFPSYFEFKYQYDYPDLTELNNWSKNSNTIMIEYFWGDSAIYAYGIEGDLVKISKIQKDTVLENHLTEFNNALRYGFNFSNQQEDFDVFNKAAWYLYSQLIQPIIEEKERAEVQKLVIIPDGYLASIPFDAFIMESKEGGRVNYRNLPYMHNSFQISYNFSSTLDVKTEKGILRPIKNLIAFSYSGEGVADASASEILTQGQLSGSVREMETISSLINNTKIYSGDDASEERFVESAPKFDIIHLAVHGVADLENGLNSRLLFPTAGGANYDAQLHPYELYDLNLKAQMVVLSACESGIGRMYSGEGIFSIARGFAFAGAPTIVMSLWKINDNVTSKLMGSFYKAIAESESVDKALFTAKSEYLEQSDELTAHPSNWASIVPIGNMNGFVWKFGISNLLLYGGLVILLLLAVGFVIARKGRRQRA